jgi:hypothetical protein
MLKPMKSDVPPAIDGRLDDPVWAEAPSVTGFKTFAPDFGRDVSEETRAYYAYDSENLYFAFQCSDQEPEKPYPSGMISKPTTSSASTWTHSTTSNPSMLFT